jgi:hypothetical protein
MRGLRDEADAGRRRGRGDADQQAEQVRAVPAGYMPAQRAFALRVLGLAA